MLMTPDAEHIRASFNAEPFQFEHQLHTLPLFSMEKLEELTAFWPEGDYFVARGAAQAGSGFYAGPEVTVRPAEAFAGLSRSSYRILLKRLERHDGQFNSLLQELFDGLQRVRPELRHERLVRLESFLFISSASTITPFHFDPEVNFFFQVAGHKTYHIYSPSVLSERELESFYLRGVVDVGQVDFESRQQAQECRFDLIQGRGMHQPANAPHWVETGSDISISYSFSFETERTRAVGRTRAFNGLIRRLGVRPRPLSQNTLVDGAKAGSMRAGRVFLDGAFAVKRLAMQKRTAV